MTRHEATFDVNSAADARAASRALENLYDTVREESRTVREGTDEADEVLAEFEQLRDAASETKPGRLTVTYETDDEGFDG